jgi:hypothetical protein
VEEKRNFRKGIILVLATLIVIGLSLKFGLKLLANLAIWVDDFRSINRTIDKNDNIPPAPPNVWAEYTATNSAYISVYGYSEPDAIITLTLNKNKTGEVIAGKDGTFVFDNVTLKEGENEINAIATDQTNNTSHPSETFKILFFSKQPKLDIGQPADGQKFSGPVKQIEVKGQTDPENRVVINGRMAVVRDDGTFVLNISLNQGDNLITVRATDIAGNSIQTEKTVSYNP